MIKVLFQFINKKSIFIFLLSAWLCTWGNIYHRNAFVVTLVQEQYFQRSISLFPQYTFITDSFIFWLLFLSVLLLLCVPASVTCSTAGLFLEICHFFCFFFCTCTAQKNKLQTDRRDIFSMVTGSASWRGFRGGLEGAGEMKTMKSPM